MSEELVENPFAAPGTPAPGINEGDGILLEEPEEDPLAYPGTPAPETLGVKDSGESEDDAGNDGDAKLDPSQATTMKINDCSEDMRLLCMEYVTLTGRDKIRAREIRLKLQEFFVALCASLGCSPSEDAIADSAAMLPSMMEEDLSNDPEICEFEDMVMREIASCLK